MPSTLDRRSASKMNIYTMSLFAGVFLSKIVLTIALRDFRRFSILHSFREPEHSSRLTGISNGLWCCLECEKMPTCIAVNFHSDNKVCELIEPSTTPLYPKDSTGWTFSYTDSKYLYHFFNAIASQKSTYKNLYVAARGIDGNTDGNPYHGSCFVTGRDTVSPWWMVDLSLNFRVERVIMWNRLDDYCGGGVCYDKLRDVLITVSPTQSGVDDSDNVCATYLGPPSSASENPVVVNCTQAMVGRYIKITKLLDINEFWYLHLCEVNFA